MSAEAAPKGNNDFQEPPPPYGWTKQIDPTSNHPFWVDTNSNPPRSIWVHPYEDEQYLREHPEARGLKEGKYAPPSEPPPTHRRHSSEGSHLRPSAAGAAPSGSRSHPGTPHPEKRGFFGKIKDAAIGTKEERETQKRQRDEINRQREEQRQAAMRAIMERARQQQQQYGRPSPYGRYVQQNPRVMYGPPPGNPYNGGGYYGRRQGGGMAMPLLGGLAGGMLLGDMIGGDGGDFGGDFGGGGGDFGGGDFGGGDF